MTDAVQIKEEQIDAGMARLREAWVSEMTSTDIIPGGGLMRSTREVAGVSHQQDMDVQHAVRLGDKVRIEQALLSQAVAAMHAYISITSVSDLEF